MFTSSILLFLNSIYAHATIYNWTNTTSGGWGAATNWSPNSVPGSTDTASITNAGVTVSLNSTTTVGAIILGNNGGWNGDAHARRPDARVERVADREPQRLVYCEQRLADRQYQCGVDRE